MRFAAVVLWMALCASCVPVREASQLPAARVMEGVKPKPLVETPTEPTRLSGAEYAGITFEGVAFDSRSHRLHVLDQASGPGSVYQDAAGAASSCGGLAAVNAGFFTKEGTPLGLVVSQGKTAGFWNAANSLGSAVWHEDASGTSAITRRENLGKQSAMAMRDLIQAGPMLVENSHTVSGLDANKSAVRTMIVWDGGSRWWIGRASSCTLAELASALATAKPAGWPVVHALNLDGGRSSDLWVSERVAGGPLVRRSLWNRPVRNFLVLMAR